jgi:hypothetical protein
MILPLSVSASVKVSEALMTPSLKWRTLPRGPISLMKAQKVVHHSKNDEGTEFDEQQEK